MDSQRRKTSTAFEYFLYAAIIAETGLAAVIYKVVFSSHELIHLRVYFAIFYFAFLAWAIAQLNMVHHDRNPAAADGTPEPAQPEPEVAIAIENKRPLLGLTGPQLVIVVVVFATAVVTFSWALRLVL